MNAFLEKIDYLLLATLFGVFIYAGTTIYHLKERCTSNDETIHSIQTTNLQKYYDEVNKIRRAQ